jgi:hypothetical protein
VALANLIIYVPAMLLLAGYFSPHIVSYAVEFELVRHIVFALILATVGAGIIAQTAHLFKRRIGKQ